MHAVDGPLERGSFVVLVEVELANRDVRESNGAHARRELPHVQDVHH